MRTVAIALMLLTCSAHAQEPPVDPAVRAFPSVVKIYGAGGFEGVPAYGTGVIVDERGFVLTSWSISLRTDQLKVVTHEGRRLKAEVWRADPGLGVALIKVHPPTADRERPEETVRLQAMPLGDSRRVQAGDEVRAVGNPFGIIYGAEAPAIAQGVVTYVGPLRAAGVNVLRLPERLERVIVTDVPSNPGTQGGPLIGRDGALLGICGRFVESRATNTIINYAVPVDLVAELVREGVASDRARPDGPRGGPRTERTPTCETGLRMQRVHLARPPMAYVETVVRGSPAEAVGLVPDDLVFRVDGRTIRSTRDWDEALDGHKPGDVLHLVVKRGDAMLKVDLTLAPGGGS